MFSRKRAETVNSTAPTPKVVEATGNWRGNDGQWSTFWINVGDKDNNGGGQNFEILPSTHSGITVLPYKSDWCDDDCADDRGVGIVNGNQIGGVQTSPDSSTWNDAGNYDIATPDWWNKTDKPVGDYGLEYLGIGKASKESWVARNMYVAATTSKDFYIGQFGLAVGATNVGKGRGQVESILSTFQNGSVIPSVSYGYTAGARYRNSGSGVYGSLVLGGYDEARINADINRVSINMPSDKNNSLVVGVQSIIYRPNKYVEQNSYGLTEDNSEGFQATIDSTLPYLYLPDSVCDEFAFRFNLEYNNETNFYTMNSTGADNNKQQNATVTFRLGSDPSGSGSDQTTINLPFSAFDLEYFDPENRDNGTRYFPIRKSSNGMFVLGRTLLQEAYLIVDYKRANFTVAQVPLLDSAPKPQLVTIYDPSYVPPTPTPIPTGGSKGLSGGAIAGIVIGILAVALGVALGIFLWWKKRRERNSAPPNYKEATEIDTAAAGNEVKHRRLTELDGAPKPTALGGYYNPADDNKNLSPFPAASEMDSPPVESPPVELYSPPAVAATPHSEGGTDYFTAGGKLGRRRATRESSANNTPGTPPPLFELPGDDIAHAPASPHADPVAPTKASPSLSSGSLAKRDTSVTRSQNNIDEVMKRHSAEPSPSPAPRAPDDNDPEAHGKPDAEEPDAVPEGERRPSHTRGASDATVQSDTTVVSQPTPEELERWALAEDEHPRRPLSE